MEDMTQFRLLLPTVVIVVVSLRADKVVKDEHRRKEKPRLGRLLRCAKLTRFDYHCS